MWILSHIESRHKLHILNDKETYTVGRVQHDLILLGDQSVSRDHAVIHRSAQGIIVEDKSRYGVFVNKGIETNKGIGTGSKTKLKVGDVVRFGRLKNIFRVEQIEFKVCCSMMPPEDIQKLANQLQLVDGKLQNSWSSDCTHLVMSTIVVTMKVLQTLIQGIPIVTPAYFNALIQSARENRSEWPDVNDFVPEITEPFLIKEPGSMQVHLDRQRIFQGKIFVFMVKRHMINFRSVIELAAGKCISLEEDRLSKKTLLKENYIPVAYSPMGESQCSEDVNGIVSYIEGNNRRLISEAEIGLAIIHRSIERFCNPDHKTIGDFQVSTLNTNELRVNILVDNTPSGKVPSQMISTSSEIIIPETVNLTETEPKNLDDNKMVEEEIFADSDKPSTSKNVPKRRATTPIKSPTTRASSKRKLNVVDDVENEPSDEQVANNNNNTRSKKAKQTNTEVEDEISSQKSSLSSDLMPPPSSTLIPHSQSSFFDSSGFISTQHRKRTTNTQNESRVELEKTNELTKEEKEQHRKRALALLNADSDDENDKDDGLLFKFSKKPTKKAKLTSTNSERIGKKRTFDEVSDNDDDDSDNPFQFSKSKTMRSQQSQKKKQSNRNNDSESVNIDTPDHASMDNENSFMTKRMTQLMKSNTTTTLDIKETSAISTDWIISKMNEKLDLNGTEQCLKKEKYEDDDEEKHNWVKSLANVFQTRVIDVNMSRNSVIDETDSVSINQTTNSTLNKSKNFKKFVKKNNYKQSSIVVKTTSIPVVVSAYSRM